MLVIPAIDIRGGSTVRLLQGDGSRALVYEHDPLAWARRWVSGGAEWLHVVDLDGAFAGRPVHLELIRQICACGVPVQAGGGFRTMESIEAALGAGVARVVVGTAARDLGTALRRLGDRVAVSIDVRDGRVALRGWTEQTAMDAAALAADLRAQGVARFIYTDITRDGMLAGPDVGALRAFVDAAGVPVIAAGGIASEADLAAAAGAGVEGVIVGRALYEGRIDLTSAVRRWSVVPC